MGASTSQSSVTHLQNGLNSLLLVENENKPRNWVPFVSCVTKNESIKAQQSKNKSQKGCKGYDNVCEK